MPRAVGNWEKRFEMSLREHPGAAGALQKLMAAGCRRELLLPLLRAVANPDKSPMYAFIQLSIPSRRRMEHAAKMLMGCGNVLRELERSPLLSAIHYRLGRAKEGLALANSMQEYGRYLQAMAKPANRLGRHMSFRRVWKHVPLAMLVHAVTAPDTEIPYSELSYLLEAASLADGLATEFSPDALRKEHSRLKARGAQRILFQSGLLQSLMSLASQ